MGAFDETQLNPRQKTSFRNEVVSVIENSIWDSLLYHSTFFDSLDGYTRVGTDVVGVGGVVVRANGAGAESYFYKTPITQNPIDGFLSFDKPSRMRVIITTATTNNQTFWFTVGTNETEDSGQDHYGFLVDDAAVYGISGNSGGTSVVNLGFSIVGDTTYELEAMHYLNRGITFSIDKKIRGRKANNLPIGDFGSADFFPHIAVRAKSAASREFTISFFEYLQRRF